mgnify:CR=1 FL=1
MIEEIEKAIADLQNPKAGWATRREAAELLGRAAVESLSALHAHRDEPDVDVRHTIDRARAEAARAMRGAAAQPQGQPAHSLEELVRACHKPGVCDVQPHGDGFKLDMRLNTGRRQVVYVEPLRKETTDWIRVLTYCAPYTGETPVWALRANARFAQAAVALVDRDGQEWFAIVNNFLAGEVTPRELKAGVKEVAFYGDWVERKLVAKDES